ncbi:DUF7286 family protein, partial [Natronolimnohabitans innermongolicus]
MQTPSPFRALTDEVEAVEDGLVETESYDTVPDQIRMAVRNAYFERLLEEIDEMATFHEEMIDDLDDAVRNAYFERLLEEIDEMATFHEEMIDDLDDAMAAGDGALEDSLEFVQAVFAGDVEASSGHLEGSELMDDLEFEVAGQAVFAGDVEASSGHLEGSELMDDLEFEVAGSPTYLDLEVVDDEEVPSVRPAGSTVMDTDEDGEHASLGVRYQQRLPTPGLPL